MTREEKMLEKTGFTSMEELEKQIIKLYLDGNPCTNGIDKIIGISSVKVRSILKKNNIPFRTMKDLPQNKRRYNMNDEYFKTQSHNMAYILGFLASDGNVSSTRPLIKITLQEGDYDFLVNISKELDIEKDDIVKIKKTNYKDRKCAELKFTSEIIKRDLKEYNIIPNKTNKLKFPDKLDKKYWIDYIRGYFDGDGCVCTSGKNAIKFQICACIPDVLQNIVDILHKEYNIPKVNVRQERKNYYVICYSIKSTMKIYDILYTKDSLYLPRKKEKFAKLVESKKNKISPRDCGSSEED